MIDAVICSINDDRFAAASASLREKLGPLGLRSIIRISDARSMTDGYNRGLSQSDAEWLIFCHDDIAVLYVEPKSFRRAIHELDVFGVAGATSLRTANWYDATIDRHAGSIVVPGFVPGPDEHGRHAVDRRRFDHQLFGCGGGPIVKKACALDGCFIAARRSTCLALNGWNREIDGWNAYDLDFAWRASHVACVGILTDIILFHASRVEFFGSKKLSQWFAEQPAFEQRYLFSIRRKERTQDGFAKHRTVTYDHLPTEAEMAEAAARMRAHQITL